MITLERWRTIEPILDAALELPESERDAYVSRQCLHDPDLYSTLTRLLVSIARTDSEFDRPARSSWNGILEEPGPHDVAVHYTLGDRFRIEQQIGSGGVETVHRAWDVRAKRPVAIRILTPRPGSGDVHAQISGAMQRAAALRHPNIIPIFDSGESAGRLYVVMPFIEGDSLRNQFASHDRLPHAEVRRIMSAVLSALDYAHNAGVIHGGLNPSNIFLSLNEVLVADFGIAQVAELIDRERTDGTPDIGTPDYLGPEQADARSTVDRRADIYSAGCILIEALTGQRPLPARVRLALAKEELDPEARRMTSRLADTPALLRCAQRAIALEPADRFQSAPEFSQSLLDALDGEAEAQPTVITPGTATPLATATPHRWRPGTLTIAYAVLLAIAISGIALARLARSRDARAVDLRTITIFPFAARDTANRDSTFAGELTHGFLDYLLYSQFYTGRDGARLASPYGLATAANQTAASHAAIVARSGGGTYVDGTWWRDDSVHVSIVVHMEGRPAVRHYQSFRRAIPGTNVGGSTFWITMQLLGHPEAMGDNVSHSGRVAAFIPAGLQAYRAQRYSDAVSRFRDVNLREPPYPFAALLGAEAASWIDRQRDAQFLSGFALRGELYITASARALEMTRGFDFFVFDRADSSIAHLRRVVSRDGPALEAWLALGTIYDRLAPRAAQPDSLAADALDHARAIDDDFLPSLYPRLVLSARLGDTTAAAAVLAQLTSYARRLGHTTEFGTESNELRAATLIVRCLTHGVASAPWDSLPVGATIEASRALTASGLRQPDCARAAWERSFERANRDRRWYALQGLQAVLLARGATAEAVRLLDTDTTVNRTERGWLAITDALAEPDTTLRTRAAAAADETLALFRSHPSLISDEALWYLGLWLAHSAQLDQLRIAHDTLLGRMTLSSDDTQRHFEQSLAARLALARGDTNSALATLTALTPNADRTTLTWTPSAAHGVDRLLLADVLLAKAQYRDAYGVASYFDSGASVTYPIFLWRSLQLRATAATRLADRAALTSIRQRQRALRPSSRPG